MQSKDILSKTGSLSATVAALVAVQAQGASGAQTQLLSQAGQAAAQSSRKKSVAQLLLLAPSGPDFHTVDHSSHSSHSSGAYVRGSGGGGDSSPIYTLPSVPSYVPPPPPVQRQPQTQLTVPRLPTPKRSTARKRKGSKRGTTRYVEPAPYVPIEGTPLSHPLEEFSGEDVAALSDWQLKILKNFYYARHGYSFPGTKPITVKVRRFFQSQKWYKPNTSSMSVASSRMSAQEKSNVSLIVQIERQRLAGGA